MEATASGAKRILECIEEAKSPQRILVRSLLKSRNALRAKYRHRGGEGKRGRTGPAAGAKPGAAGRRRPLAEGAPRRDRRARRAALEARTPRPWEPSAAPAEPAAAGARPA